MSFLPLKQALLNAGLKPNVTFEKNSKKFEIYSNTKMKIQNQNEIIISNEYGDCLKLKEYECICEKDSNLPTLCHKIHYKNCQIASEEDCDVKRIVFPNLEAWILMPFVLPHSAKPHVPVFNADDENHTLEQSLKSYDIQPQASVTQLKNGYIHRFYGDINHIITDDHIFKLRDFEEVAERTTSWSDIFDYHGQCDVEYNHIQKEIYHVFPSQHYKVNYTIKLIR